MKKLLQRLFAPLAALLALTPANAATLRPSVARPALWSVSDADTTVYLFGTIHLLPENYEWETPKIGEAVSSSQQLMVETIVDQKDPSRLMTAMAALAFNTPNLPPLSARVPENKRAALAEAVRKTGLPPQAFDRMETWAAAFILLGNQFKDMGLKGGEGVEIVLRKAFAEQGKPVGELETNIEQLGFFDKLPESAQRQLLVGSIESGKGVNDEFKAMLAAWARGDVPEIAKWFNRDLSGSPELSKALIKQRNANWSRWIEQRMTQPGQIMVAVGAGHLAGKDSVIDLLKRDGWKVKRLQ